MIRLRAHGFDAEFEPELGGLLHRLRWNGTPLLHEFRTRDEHNRAPACFGIPVLFPPNRVEDGEFTFRGRNIRLPLNEPAPRNNHLHGVLLRAEWHPETRTDDTLTLHFRYDRRAPEFPGCPFPADFRLTVSLADRTVTQTLRISNLGETDMPCALGFHTAFVCPKRMKLSSGHTALEIPPPRHLPTGRRLDWHGHGAGGTWFAPEPLALSRHFPSEGAPEAVLDYDAFTLTYRPDPALAWWMLWKPAPGCGFVCPEPMNIPVNAHRTAPEHLPALPPHTEQTVTSFIRID